MVLLQPLSKLELADLETPAVLKSAIAASRQLAELKGAAASIPLPSTASREQSTGRVIYTPPRLGHLLAVAAGHGRRAERT